MKSAIAILTYNRVHPLIECLRGVLRHCCDYEIAVFEDAGYHDNTADYLQQKREPQEEDDELEAVRNYLEVERIRFGDRLRITFEVEPGVETCLVPPLVLQPLVENAVLHGVAPRTEGGEVRVHVSQSNPGLVLCVEDDGPGNIDDRVAKPIALSRTPLIKGLQAFGHLREVLGIVQGRE